VKVKRERKERERERNQNSRRLCRRKNESTERVEYNKIEGKGKRGEGEGARMIDAMRVRSESTMKEEREGGRALDFAVSIRGLRLR